jgi:glycosyltransferase involved in cell wall biosynthesis
MQDLAPAGATIDVITTMPNRYQSFSSGAQEIETQGIVSIRRMRLPSHQSDMAGQSRAFLAFARQALNHVDPLDYQLVFATSSRLMTAWLGAMIARRKKIPLYLDIRDIFVDTLESILPRSAMPLMPALSWLERWTMRQAEHINLVSPGFTDYFRQRYPNTPLSLHTNGIDEEFLSRQANGGARVPNKRLKILYAGNIGEGQALHRIVPQLASVVSTRADFCVIGDGGRRRELERAIAECGATNVTLSAPVNRSRLLELYEESDVLFLHLGAVPAFEKVLPSKIFEYAALGKPILAGVGGSAARFLEQEVENSAVFAPGDVDGAVRALAGLQIADRHRTEFIEKFSRRRISEAMAAEIWALASRIHRT